MQSTIFTEKKTCYFIAWFFKGFTGNKLYGMSMKNQNHSIAFRRWSLLIEKYETKVFQSSSAT